MKICRVCGYEYKGEGTPPQVCPKCGNKWKDYIVPKESKAVKKFKTRLRGWGIYFFAAAIMTILFDLAVVLACLQEGSSVGVVRMILAILQIPLQTFAFKDGIRCLRDAKLVESNPLGIAKTYQEDCMIVRDYIIAALLGRLYIIGCVAVFAKRASCADRFLRSVTAESDVNGSEK